MASRSLDSLLEFLIGEIALCGSRGATLSDIASWVKGFYTDKNDVQASSQNGKIPTSPCVDRKFLARVWRWLGSHPETSLGADHEFDASTLDDIEELHPGYTIVPCDTSATQDQSQSTPDDSTNSDAPRVFVSEERMFNAICGHGPDPTRVFPSEFQLLCAIAATKEKGILQGELGRLTGQDKRSVPKRTDALSAKGYIVKRGAWMGGHKTSKLLLRRFAPIQLTSVTSMDDASRNEPSMKDAAIQLFAALKASPLMTQEEVGKYIGLDDAERDKILPCIIQHFTKQSCLKKVKTAFGPSANSKDLKTCIHVLREPVESDWYTSDGDALDFALTITEFVMRTQVNMSPEDGQDDGVVEGILSQSESSDAVIRKPPCWNPDRPLPNIIHNIVNSIGADGLTNLSARNKITGLSVRRPLEALLVRLSHRSLLSQPDSCRHLAILRTQQNADGVLTFFHKSLETFLDEVAQGTASVSDVVGGDVFLKRQDVLAAAAHDKFGFVIDQKPEQQHNDGKIGLGDLIRSSRTPNISVRPGEPALPKPGVYTESITVLQDDEVSESTSEAVVNEKGSKRRNRPKVAKRNESRKPRQSDTSPLSTPKGRRSKFIKGTERFWREMFLKAKMEIDPTIPRVIGSAISMNDPAGQSLFENRPSSFDEILLKALSEGLPVPARPDDVNMDWVNRTKMILERHDPGLYVSPTGRLLSSLKPQSLMIILRSSRLDEVDFVDRSVISPVHFLSSSKAHTMVYLRYYSRLDTSLRSTEKTLSAQKPETSKLKSNATKKKPLKASKATPIRKRNEDQRNSISGPVLGRFFEPTNNPTIDQSPIDGASPSIILGADTYSIGESTDATVSDPDLPERSVQNTLPTSTHRTRKTTSRSFTISRTPLKEINSNKGSAHVLDNHEEMSSGSKSLQDSNNMKTTADTDPTVSTPSLPESSAREVHSQKPGTDNKNNAEERATGVSEETDPNDDAIDLLASNHTLTRSLHITPCTSLDPIGCDASKLAGHTLHDEILGQARNQNSNDVPDQYRGPLSSMMEPSDLVQKGSDIERSIYYPDATMERMSEHVSLIQPSTAPIVMPEGMSGMADTSVQAEDDLSTPRSVSQEIGAPNQSSKRKASTARRNEPINEAKNIQNQRQPRILKGREGVDYYRRFIMELVEMCSGVAPNDPSMFKRAMKAKCIEANVDFDVNAKIIKTSIKALCERGKLKMMYFSFDSGGIMNTKTVVALPDITGFDPRYLEIQARIKATSSDEDYFPPELEGEAVRKPLSLARIIHPAAEESDAEGDGKKARRKRKKARREREESVASSSSQDEDDLSPEPELSLNTGFLTLKVPGIAGVKTDTIFTSRFYALPVVELNIRGDEVTVNDGTSNQNNRTGRRMIQWSKEPILLPTSLRALLTQHRRNKSISAQNQNLRSFDAKIDAVMQWEHESMDHLVEPKEGEWHFINHTSIAKATKYIYVESQPGFRSVSFTPEGTETETLLEQGMSWPLFAEALRRISSERVLRTEANKSSKRKSKGTDYDDDNDTDEPILRPGKRRRLQRRRSTKATIIEDESADSEDPSTKPQSVVKRKPRVDKKLSEEVRIRFCMAVICIRTLTGGIERHIEWSMVANLFPEYRDQNLQQWWDLFAEVYVTDIESLTEKLQEAYISAFQKDSAPVIDFENPKNTNWEKVVNWAMANLDTKEIVSESFLPRTREEFMENNKIELTELRGARDIYHVGLIFTQAKREALFCSITHGIARPNLEANTTINNLAKSTAELDNLDDELSIAKSWIMATLATPQDKFDAVTAHRKLLRLAADSDQCERLVDRALRALQRDKMIAKHNGLNTFLDLEKETTNNQMWTITGKFFDQFDSRRLVSANMLREAARYKLVVLDSKFATGDPIELPKSGALDDGQCLALLNLLNLGMVRVVPGKDIPASRYGLDWQNLGYKTKIMDRNSIDFTVMAGATSDYLLGDPMERIRKHICIPANEDDGTLENAHISPWFDIHGGFRPELWEMFLAAVVGLVSMRPGALAMEITSTLQWYLTIHDVQRVLDFLFQCKAIREVYDGYETTEWWWMVLGIGFEDGQTWRSSSS